MYVFFFTFMRTFSSPCSIWRCFVTTVGRFEFIKVCMENMGNMVCMGTQRFCWKSQFCLYFVNKICVVFFLLFASSSDRSNAISASYRSAGLTSLIVAVTVTKRNLRSTLSEYPRFLLLNLDSRRANSGKGLI